MTSSRLRAVVLAIAASLLAGCATDPSDGASCPTVVSYSQELLARAAGELKSLPAGSAIEQMQALVDGTWRSRAEADPDGERIRAGRAGAF